MAEWDQAEGDAESEISSPVPAFVRDPIGVLRRRWKWMLGCLVVGFCLTAAIVATRQATYLARTTILVSSQEIPEEFVRTTVNEDSLAHINAIVGQVLSRPNLAELVEKYQLYPEQREALPLAAIIDRMRGDIAIWPQQSMNQTRGAGSQVFVITYSSTDRRLAADVANELAGFFTAANIEMRNRQAELTTDFLRREMQRAEQDLRDQERKITEFTQANRGGLPGELAANIARLERLQSQRQSLATQIDAAESRLMMLNAQTDDVPQGPTPRSLLSDLKAQLEHQLVILTEEHPNVIALRRRIERLEADVVEQESTPATALSDRALQIAAEQRQLRNLRTQAGQIELAISSLDEHVMNTPVLQEEFAALEQRATVLRENYLAFLRKVQEAELAQSLESAQHGARISVLDRAAPPNREEHPRWKVMLAGITGTLGLAFVLAIALELMDGVVVGQKQLESITDKPMLGSVPRIA